MGSEVERVRMVDLSALYVRYEVELREAVLRVASSGCYIRGAEVEALEAELAEYVGVRHCRCCANGTEALQIALMAAGLKAGDEVITTTYSFIATAEVCALLGLKVVFADIDPRTFNISTDGLERLLTPRTRAIVPVDLFGLSADMGAVCSFAERHGLVVIEDVAQSFGAEAIGVEGRRRLCSVGHVGCTSFFPTKNLGCMGDGGAVFTDDDELARRMAIVSSHGAERKYHSTEVGLNSRLDALQAAVLRVKLPHLDEFISHRRAVAKGYAERLSELSEHLTLPVDDPRHTYNQYTVRVLGGRRDSLRAFLKERGVDSMVYFPEPIHRQPVFARLGDVPELPEADRASAEVLSLPIHSEMTEGQVDYVCDTIRRWTSSL